MALVGNEEIHNEENMRNMWMESMKSVNCSARITYDKFLLLMKGQTTPVERPPDKLPHRERGPSLEALPEGEQVEHGEEVNEHQIKRLSSQSIEVVDPKVLFEKDGDDVSMSSMPNLGEKMEGSSSSSLNAGASPVVNKPVLELPESPVTPGSIRRPRSCSMPGDEPNTAQFTKDARRAVALPGHENSMDEDKNLSNLTVNRQLYRAHRQMRLSVMEATKRFEEQRARRARDELVAIKEEEARKMGIVPAGLVMKHGTKVHVTSEAIRELMEKQQEEQQALVQKANRRGGRGRASRKKTISDMSGMMISSMGQDELGDIAGKAATRTPDANKTMFHASFKGGLDMPSLPEGAAQSGQQGISSALTPRSAQKDRISLELVENAVRGATVPGNFKKTQDPFSSEGLYGGARMTAEELNKISTRESKLKNRIQGGRK